MCSIFGYYSTDRHENLEECAVRALEATRYRGPDFSDFKVFTDCNAVLGHNRLSIIDLSSSANQPMSSSDGRIWLVFNGEIYNFLEIRANLEKKGYNFRTHSDTEVIIAAYQEYGLDFVKHFDGMFALGIFDLSKRQIIIARDIAGEKPLFYYYNGCKFIFSSELKQIFIQNVKKDFLFEVLTCYFAFGFLPHDITFFVNIHKLPPAHLLIFNLNDNSCKLGKYWEIPDFEKAANEVDAIQQVEDILHRSVKSRLISDVPLGVFLSGGIDSSLTAAFAQRSLNTRIKTFSVGFEGSAKNETAYARIVANHIESDHTEIIVKPQVGETLKYVANNIDEPIYDTSIIPTYHLCKETRAYVKTVLSGDGGDELFAGYLHYHSAIVCNEISKKLPFFLRKTGSFVGSFLPDGMFGKNTLMSIGMGRDDCYVYPTQIFKEHEIEVLLRGIIKDIKKPSAFKKDLMTSYKGDFINKMCAADMYTNLQEILVKVDRASMFNSLEVRTPFLNRELIEFSFKNIHGSLKMKNNTKKYLLKELAKKYLPVNFPLERKQGFDIPSDLLEKSDVLDLMGEMGKLSFLNENYINGLINLQRQRKGHYWNKLFAVYMFKAWYLKWVA